MSQREWFRFANKADEPTVAHLYIYDAIGPWYMGDDPVSAKRFLDALKALPEAVDTIRVHISSPGGDVMDALAIANSLRMHRARVETSIEGMAASAATIVSSVGESIAIFDNATVMIHDPYAMVIGNAKYLRKVAEDLDRARDQIVTTYRLNSKLEPEALAALMDAETWMSADEAIANGFATEKITGLKVAACLRPEVLTRYGAIPSAHRSTVEALIVRPEPAPLPADALEVARTCNAAGFPELTERLLGQPMASVTAQLEEAKAAKAHRETREREIRGLCATAKLPELADGYVAGVMAAADVKTHLTTITAKLAGVEIDGHPPADGRPAVMGLNATEIYRERNTPVAKGA
jgi:ATP-dependent protease ClpP protease subunit